MSLFVNVLLCLSCTVFLRLHRSNIMKSDYLFLPQEKGYKFKWDRIHWMGMAFKINLWFSSLFKLSYLNFQLWLIIFVTFGSIVFLGVYNLTMNDGD